MERFYDMDQVPFDGTELFRVLNQRRISKTAACSIIGRHPQYILNCHKRGKISRLDRDTLYKKFGLDIPREEEQTSLDYGRLYETIYCAVRDALKG